jgi:spoIIIJ-associated protein
MSDTQPETEGDQLQVGSDPAEESATQESGFEESADAEDSGSEESAPEDSGPEESGSEESGSEESGPDESGETSRKGKSDPEALASEAEIAADYLEELLDIADLDGDIDTFIEGDRAHVSIVSESNVLVGSSGNVLDALQELARLAVMTETGQRSRLMLDVAGFRERRRSELISIAGEAVEEVKTSQEKVPLAPMNPFERKIIHDAVAAAGLTSASEGEEPDRHVVVLPVG